MRIMRKILYSFKILNFKASLMVKYLKLKFMLVCFELFQFFFYEFGLVWDWIMCNYNYYFDNEKSSKFLIRERYQSTQNNKIVQCSKKVRWMWAFNNVKILRIFVYLNSVNFKLFIFWKELNAFCNIHVFQCSIFMS